MLLRYYLSPVHGRFGNHRRNTISIVRVKGLSDHPTNGLCAARIENGQLAEVVYGNSYPAYPPARQDPRPEEFYCSAGVCRLLAATPRRFCAYLFAAERVG